MKIVFDSPKKVVVGSAVAQANGEFDATVKLPKAQPGRHELQVEGIAVSGRPTTWAARVVMLTNISQDVAPQPSVAAPVMLAIAIAFPLGTWFVLQLPGRRRPRQHGTGPRS